MKALGKDVYVGGQVCVEELEQIAASGIRTLINNRPDGEMPGQPSHSEIKTAAEALGLTYVYLPMAGGLTPDLVSGSEEAYASVPRPILAYCASGTRSAALWCFASVKSLGVETVLESAAKSGYNLEQLRSGLMHYIDT